MESNTKQSDAPLSGVIRLKLKKPKEWNWELTTSKSSPNISIPVVQLLDDNGNLLTEANDPNGCCHRSWNPERSDNITQSIVVNHQKSLRNSFHAQQSSVRLKANVNELEKKYKLRSSKAGTLIVSDDSFEKRPREHRNYLPCIDNSDVCLNKFGNYFEHETLSNLTKSNIVHRKTKSDLGLESIRLPTNGSLYPIPDNRLFKTRVVQCGKAKSLTDSNHIELNKLKLKRIEAMPNLTYTVQEPITPLSTNNKNMQSFCMKKKIRRKYLTKSENINDNECLSTDDDTAFESRKQLRRRRKKKGDRILEIDGKPISDLESATKHLQSAPDGILLRLGRCSSSTNIHDTCKERDHDTIQSTNQITNEGHLNTMGANVSRHSGKGLSGRRTQSSGNLCNRNKQSSNVSRLLGPCATTDAVLTPNQQQTVNVNNRFCGSLPNNLDDTDSLQDCEHHHHHHHTIDNNNHLTSNNSQIAIKPSSYFPKKYHAPSIPTLQTYKTCDPNDYELRLQPLHVNIPGNNNDTGLYDQGYGSERSPEDEYASRPVAFENSEGFDLYSKYPFITAESIFTVTLTKNSRGLGLSVTGGADCPGPWSGLIRVKRLFPNQPAATCGLLSTGDLILAANGLTLTGLTNYEALEVLRTTPSNVILTVCRPPPEILSAVSPLSDVPPPPPKRDPPYVINTFSGLTPYEDCYNGEFDLILTKIQGSLGFTLRKEDESALGHYVRALVREPALSDGRIKPGDKIVTVNDVELSSLSHEEAVQFLRQCGQEVKIRLYRDAAQTPVAALSPTEPDSPLKLKPLRQEAVDMLSDLAVRKLSPCNNPPPLSPLDSDNYWQQNKEDSFIICNKNSIPRRCVRRTLRTTPDSDFDRSSCIDKKGSYKYHSSQIATSDSDSFSQNASFGSENNNRTRSSSNESESERPTRPSFLNLSGISTTASTPINRKPKFQFSLAHNAYELNNLDPDVLDAPNLTFTFNKNNNEFDNEFDSQSQYCTSARQNLNDQHVSDEPVSMPPMASSRGDDILNNINDGFNPKNPSYQSAHPKCGGAGIVSSCDDSNNTTIGPERGSRGLLKWKGVVFTADTLNADDQSKSNIIHAGDSDFKIITVELNRGWNSRLGFSLQQGNSDETFISAVHPDSVAAKDGRLQPGDQLIRVNDENVEKMTTNEVIDLLRIVRGPVCIVVARKVII